MVANNITQPKVSFTSCMQGHKRKKLPVSLPIHLVSIDLYMLMQVNCCTSVYAGIYKLVDVKNALKRVNDWQSLGLQLGLLYPTLEKIETDNNSKVEQCKTKMIAAWLKRQDNVPNVGVPTWSVLQRALRKIGENEVADRLPQNDDDTTDVECVTDASLLSSPSGLWFSYNTDVN